MGSRAESLPPVWWRDPEQLQAQVAKHGTFVKTSRAHGIPTTTLKSAWAELGLPPRTRGHLRVVENTPEQLAAPRAPKAVPAGERKATAGLQRVFFIGDAHIPYHDQRGLSIWLKALSDFKPDIVVSMGDFVDCFAVSSYSKDPRRVFHLQGEMEQAGMVLDQINKLCPKARRIYIAGNHEDRLQRYLQDKAPELFPFVDIPKLLHLNDRGWEYVPYKKSIRIGKVHLTHDVGSAGRYNAFRALEAFQSPVVTGHTHRMSYVVEGDATGGTQVSAQFGWLGDVRQVDYMHEVQAQKNWTLGFGYGYIDPRSGYVYLVPVPIVNYTAVVEGRLYTAASVSAARKKAA